MIAFKIIGESDVIEASSSEGIINEKNIKRAWQIESQKKKKVIV